LEISLFNIQKWRRSLPHSLHHIDDINWRPPLVPLNCSGTNASGESALRFQENAPFAQDHRDRYNDRYASHVVSVQYSASLLLQVLD